MQVKYDVLANTTNELGEGLFFDKKSQKILWLDIILSKLFVLDSNQTENDFEEYDLVSFPSAILSVDWPIVRFAHSVGVSSFNCKTREIIKLGNIEHNSNVSMRMNDGCELKSGSYFLGSMGLNGEFGEGRLYLLEGGAVLKSSYACSIPNTFIELDNVVLVSDSESGIVYQHEKEDLLNKRSIWKTLGDSDSTPDGGCRFGDNLLIAFWRGSCIKEFNTKGDIIREFKLPVLQPTNCVVNDRYAYITSARVGMTEKELSDFPLSGALLKIDLGEMDV